MSVPFTNSPARSPSRTFADILRDALRYWEFHRIPYNLLLVALALGWLIRTWPHFRPALTLQSVPYLVVYCVLANIGYSAAYLADIPLQLSDVQPAYRRWRWLLWLGGALLAFLFSYYWIADEIYPYVT
ncbi:MAG: hypothetical protein ACM3JD_05730 [Rudaea sp.]